ncbi:MAG: 50S ribosomal protein L11 methyltransferase [Deltaproteobacteria bacterium]|nr:50S ribosomal protein L11 methyltransferase [Deltaproteobacteria bacterium]
MCYDRISSHAKMLRDVVRTEAYDRAISEVIKPGQKAIDFGCGTGILSHFCARAGASDVYAIDRSLFIAVARVVAQRNGLENIHFIYSEGDKVKLPAKADVLVSEWMGVFLFWECMLEPLIKIRDQYLAEDGVMLPSRMFLKGAFVSDEELFKEMSFFRFRPYSVDFSVVGDWLFHTPTLKHFSEKQVLDYDFDLGEMDMKECREMPAELSAVVSPMGAATIYGICGWFEAELAPKIHLGTGPFDPFTHWEQIFFPLSEPFELVPGKEVKVVICPAANPSVEETVWRWSVSDGQTTIEMDENIHLAWIYAHEK